jgi:ATP adenylyltransferase
MNIGVNQGSAAGAGLAEHMHVHLVPRWRGDLNFMPVIGAVSVMPEALDATYARLAPHFRALDESPEQSPTPRSRTATPVRTTVAKRSASSRSARGRR